MKILFAEDDRDLSTAVKTLLERTGYLVDAVYDGAEAIDYAEADSGSAWQSPPRSRKNMAAGSLPPWRRTGWS